RAVGGGRGGGRDAGGDDGAGLIPPTEVIRMRWKIGTLGLVGVAFVAGLVAGQVGAQAKPRMWADVVLDVVTDEIPRRTRVHVNVDHWDPGAETGRHTHPGPVVFVMLEGELLETRADGSTNV